MGAVERVRELVTPIVRKEGVELYDVEHESGVLRIMVDRPGGIDVDTIGDVSLKISQALDLTDPVPDSRYLLEVKSPGIERKLRVPAHFQAKIGEQITVKVNPNVEGDRRLDGVLISSDEDGIELAVGQADLSVVRRLSYGDIESARTVFNWGRESDTERPKGQAKSKSKASTSKTPNKKASAR